MLQAAAAAGPLRAHTLAVNDAAICFLKAARERGDEFGPFSWRQEVAHPMSRGRDRRHRALFADAVLTYMRPEDDETVLEQCFLELHRATLSVDRLVAELSRYAQLYRATDAEGRPLWRDHYPVFPRALCVLTGASREASKSADCGLMFLGGRGSHYSPVAHTPARSRELGRRSRTVTHDQPPAGARRSSPGGPRPHDEEENLYGNHHACCG